MLTPREHSEHGFTLVEVVVAMFILAVAATGLTLVMAGASKNTNKAKLKSKVSAIADGAWETAIANTAWRYGKKCATTCTPVNETITDKDITATVKATASPSGLDADGFPTGYTMTVVVTAFDATGKALTNGSATLTGEVEAFNPKAVGTLMVRACVAVNQVDERLPIQCGVANEVTVKKDPKIVDWTRPSLPRWTSNPPAWQYSNAQNYQANLSLWGESYPTPGKLHIRGYNSTVTITGLTGEAASKYGTHTVTLGSDGTWSNAAMPVGNYKVQMSPPPQVFLRPFRPWKDHWMPLGASASDSQVPDEDNPNATQYFKVGAYLDTNVMRVYRPGALPSLTLPIHTLNQNRPWHPCWVVKSGDPAIDGDTAKCHNQSLPKSGAEYSSSASYGSGPGKSCASHSNACDKNKRYWVKYDAGNAAHQDVCLEASNLYQGKAGCYRNTNSYRNQFALIPFPNGREFIEGNGPNEGWHQSGELVPDLYNWADVREGQGTATFEWVKPGLYKAQVYRNISYLDDANRSWAVRHNYITTRAVVCEDLHANGAPLNGECDKSHLPFLFVKPDGTTIPKASDISISMPACNNNERWRLAQYYLRNRTWAGNSLSAPATSGGPGMSENEFNNWSDLTPAYDTFSVAPYRPRYRFWQQYRASLSTSWGSVTPQLKDGTWFQDDVGENMRWSNGELKPWRHPNGGNYEWLRTEKLSAGAQADGALAAFQSKRHYRFAAAPDPAQFPNRFVASNWGITTSSGNIPSGRFTQYDEIGVDVTGESVYGVDTNEYHLGACSSSPQPFIPSGDGGL